MRGYAYRNDVQGVPENCSHFVLFKFQNQDVSEKGLKRSVYQFKSSLSLYYIFSIENRNGSKSEKLRPFDFNFVLKLSYH